MQSFAAANTNDCYADNPVILSLDGDGTEGFDKDNGQLSRALWFHNSGGELFRLSQLRFTCLKGGGTVHCSNTY
ncbi:hypothetical protein BOA8489_04036 [Boseongicola aestuarii]|uniref:Uncharacterized protein n=2 Tax=Boseongicola aestuarii TaxID=1470561 RepID=A0A238J6C6_9RHOB|nr:hypothetical protein BOA8489_04036 [Boseongicola aestuarii]